MDGSTAQEYAAAVLEDMRVWKLAVYKDELLTLTERFRVKEWDSTVERGEGLGTIKPRGASSNTPRKKAAPGTPTPGLGLGDMTLSTPTPSPAGSSSKKSPTVTPTKRPGSPTSLRPDLEISPIAPLPQTLLSTPPVPPASTSDQPKVKKMGAEGPLDVLPAQKGDHEWSSSIGRGGGYVEGGGQVFEGELSVRA